MVGIHTGEVQLRQREIHQFAIDKQSHEHYEFFRSYFNGCEADSLTRCFSLLANIHGAKDAGGGLLEHVERELASATAKDAFRLENLADFLETTVCEGKLAFKVWQRAMVLLSDELASGGCTPGRAAKAKADAPPSEGGDKSSATKSFEDPEADTEVQRAARIGHCMNHISRICRRGGLAEPAVATALLSLRCAGNG